MRRIWWLEGARLTFSMLCLWLKFFLPSGVFGCAIQFRDLSESNDKLVLRLCSHTSAYGIGARLCFQVIEAKKDASSADEPNDRLAAFEAFEQTTDPLRHPWLYASGE